MPRTTMTSTALLPLPIDIAFPLTEACLRFSRTSLFNQLFPQRGTWSSAALDVGEEVSRHSAENFPT